MKVQAALFYLFKLFSEEKLPNSERNLMEEIRHIENLISKDFVSLYKIKEFFENEE